MSHTNESNSYMRVEKWEFASEFSQLSCPTQTRTRVTWELRSESLHQSFLNSHVPFKREQELHESWWELRSESFHESFLNSHVPIKLEQELYESWWELMKVAKREFAWEFSQLSCPVQTRTKVTCEFFKVNWILPVILYEKKTTKLKIDESQWKLAIKREQ
jgi:hypothetical protein